MVAVTQEAEGPDVDSVGDRCIHGQGTPECIWRGWNGLPALATMAVDQFSPRGSRVIVVSPHPDDEVLGCGGTLALLAREGYEVLVVGVTDGEAAYPGSTIWTPSALARQRHIERAEGLVRLGVRAPAYALGLPDGGITSLRPSLSMALRALLRPGDTVLTTWRRDGHPDHEAAGHAAAEAAAEHGCRLWEVPVWMWHWAAPRDARVPWERMRRIALDADVRDRKARAIAAHTSQLVETPVERLAPVLPDWALARLMRPFEAFIGGDTP